MLCKTLKHDFISTGRIMGVIYAIVAGLAAATLISHYAKSSTEMSVAEALGVIVLLLISLCLFILTAVVIFMDFHKTLYAEQGYLTFTLPVKSWMILLSKILVSTTWFVLALAALFGSLWVSAVVMKEEILGENYDMLMGLLSQISNINISSLILSVVIRVILYFIQFSFFTITLFFTSTLANTRLLQKRSVLWTILLFIPISLIATQIANAINNLIVFTLFFVDGGVKLVTDNTEYLDLISKGNSPIDIASIFVYIILSAGIFYATHYIMSKKVNIR